MYILTTKYHFDSAHFLKGYDGACSNIHGHRWNVEVSIYNDDLIEDGAKRGMIVDFSTLKKDLKEVLDNLDHALIIEKNTLKSNTLAALKSEDFRILEFDFRPTAENFSKYLYDVMKGKGYNITSLTVYETPNNCCTYKE